MKDNPHKYELLLDNLKRRIRSRQIGYGDKIPSENELARQFSISRFTVRHAIELLTNEGWLEKRHGSGTFVKIANFDKPRTNIVGVVTTYLDDYIFPGIVKAVEQVLTGHGYSLHLGITGNQVEKERLCLRAMLEQNVDGLILEPTKSALPNPNLDLLGLFAQRHIPVFFINSRYEGCDCSYVMMDDERAGFLAGEHLIERGHRRIAAVFKSDDLQGHRRYQGFLRSLHTHGLLLSENAVVWYTTEDLPTLFAAGSGPALLRRFAGSTAVVCYNDQIALKTIDLLAQGGLRVPEDMSVVGFDDSDLCRVSSVPLTSVAHAQRQIGLAAAEGLLGLIQGGPPVQRLLPPELVARDSVKRLNG